MALTTTKFICYRNGAKNLSNANSRLSYLNYEQINRNNSFRSLCSSIEIYKKAPFSPWNKTRNTYPYYENFSLRHSYSTLQSINKVVKTTNFTHANKKEVLSLCILNNNLNVARASTSTKEKSNDSPSKLKRFGGAIALGITAGAGKIQY